MTKIMFILYILILQNKKWNKDYDVIIMGLLLQLEENQSCFCC